MQFVDIAVYLMPGLLVVLSLVFCFYPTLLSAPAKKIGFVELILILGVSYIIGIIINKLSFLVLYPSYLIARKAILERIVFSFPEIDKVKAAIAKNLQIKNIDIDYVWYYRYAQSIVAEKYPESALVADRLLYMSLLCRNLLVSIPLSAFFFCIQLVRRGKWRKMYFLGLIVIFLLMGLFYKAFTSYWKTSVWRTLRAYLIWQSIG